MNPKLFGSALIAVVIVAVAVVLVFSGGSDDETAVASPTVPRTIVTSETPTPSPTLETAPDATATPVPDAETQARNLTLVEAPEGMLQFTTDGPYVVPADAQGVFYLNIETQQIEGWFDLVPGGSHTSPVAFSGENRFTVFNRSRETFAGGIIYRAGDYLADRESRKVYRWDGDAELVNEKLGFNASEIAARGDLVLFRVPDAAGDDWFSLLDVSSGEVVAAFRAEGTWALISEDASKVAIAGEDVFVVDVATGEVETVEDGDIDEVDLEGNVELKNAGDGASFLFASNPAKPQFRGFWKHYTWDGDLLAEGEGARVYMAPNGNLVAVVESIAEEPDSSSWHVLSALDTSDGADLFRVVGVDERFGREWPENPWLVDGSGIVVALPDNRRQVAHRGGSFSDYIGAPSPASPDVFATSGGPTGGVGAVDADGVAIVNVSFPGGIRDFYDRWGDRGEEVRVLIPHGGHDGPPHTVTIVEPYVEEAPYDGEPQLQLSEVAVAFGLLRLYNEPGGETVVGQVEPPHRVMVHEVAWRCSGGSQTPAEICAKVDSTVVHEFMALVGGGEVGPDAPLSSYWARVSTPDGQEGWLLVQANIQGI